MSNNQINYKQKYTELKMKFMESVDTAFRLGYEQGVMQAQQDQAAMQQQQAMEMQQQAQQGPDFSGNGAEGSQPGAEQMANPNGGEIQESDSMNPAGSELDQHIEKLESMIAKSELNPEALTSLISEIRSSQAKSQERAVLSREMKKSQAAIPAIAKALHRPAFKIGQQASHNMNDSAKKAVTMQEKIVSDIMKSWADEESQAKKDVINSLDIAGLLGKK